MVGRWQCFFNWGEVRAELLRSYKFFFQGYVLNGERERVQVVKSLVFQGSGRLVGIRVGLGQGLRVVLVWIFCLQVGGRVNRLEFFRGSSLGIIYIVIVFCGFSGGWDRVDRLGDFKVFEVRISFLCLQRRFRLSEILFLVLLLSVF